jgi:hypothetical protein
MLKGNFGTVKYAISWHILGFSPLFHECIIAG